MDPTSTIQIVAGIFARRAVVLWGGWLAAHGVAQASTQDIVAGAVVLALTVLWSYAGRIKLLNTAPPTK